VNPTDADLERLDNEQNPPITRQKNDHLPEVADGTMSGSITVHRPPDPMAMVASAIEKGMDPQKILDFIDRVNATKATEKFAASLAKFQAECPQILKERQVSFGQSKGGYKFASYDDINKAIAPLLKECEIVVTFSVEPQMQGNLLVGTCFIRVGSHCVPTTLPIPIAKGMNTNDAQNFGGTMTYLKRYLICAALNIIITDNLEEDRDGADGFITPDQVAEVNAALERCKEAGQPVTLNKFLSWIGETTKTTVESIDKIPMRALDNALNFLARKAKGGAK
jgi:hypothetical protein